LLSGKNGNSIITNCVLNVALRSQLDSVQVWKAFAETYGDQHVSLKRRDHIIMVPNMTLNDYIKPTISDAFGFLTFLTLSNVMVSLYRLVNIGALTIGKGVKIGDAGLDDSIVRTWSRAAAKTGAFSELRVLSCRFQRYLSRACFEHLNHFPALAVFITEDCDFGPRDKEMVRTIGWKYRTSKDLEGFLMDSGLKDHKWDNVMAAAFQCSGPLSVERLTDVGVEALDALPVLHFSLGGVPPAAALDLRTDERTRCFERVSRTDTTPLSLPSKRHMSEVVQSSSQSRKKPLMRASKQQQSFEDLLQGFGA